MRWFLMLTNIFLVFAATTVSFAQSMQPSAPQEIRNPDQALLEGFLIVSAIGVGGERFTHRGQRKAMAIRAAQVLAYRELLETVQGIRIASGDTTVRNAMADDVVRARVEGVIRGAQTIYKHYDAQEDIATVYVRLPLKGQGSVTEALLPHLKAIPPPPDSAPYVLPSTPPPAQPADGLIVDVREYAFRPALVNRILTEKGEILYDPSKIAQGILVERGSGDYTTDLGKAKAILSRNGSNNPLTVKAVRVVHNTNAQISNADATAIFAANQETNFLEGAKVVFVLR